ncbi:hypothetical protein [Legionella oakridgensis]|nr:hypothetical protein [Legionella oakridgensis]ETO93115.1 hypothetical protein LOR_48c08460 [Legionella oakridgensis RV-2-2007]
MKGTLLFFIFSFYSAMGFCDTILSNNQPPAEGNFALPAPQQPGPFLSFGQNIIGKNQIQIDFDPSYLYQTNSSFLALSTSFLYGLSDTASIFFTLPVAVKYTTGSNHSSGLSDVSLQGEYAFYDNSNSKSTQQATMVTAITFPTGSSTKNPPTGNDTYNFFIGGTYNQIFIDWSWFVSPGINWFAVKDHTLMGSQYLYQFGIGKNFQSQRDRFIWAGLLELDGVYSEKNKLFGKKDPNSGGNIVNITPSLWYSTQTLIIQAGIAFPLLQQWNGNQSKTNYYATATLTWTID